MNAAGNEDGSIKQPLLILNADNGQQLYKGNTSHWRVWQSLIEEGEQLDDRDEVFRQAKPCLTRDMPCHLWECLLCPLVVAHRVAPPISLCNRLSGPGIRWHDRLVLQPFTTINEEGIDIYTVVDNDSGQILYSGPDEEPKPGEKEELESQLHAIVPHHEGAEDHGMQLKVTPRCACVCI